MDNKYLNDWHAFDSTELFLKKFQKSIRSILNYEQILSNISWLFY